MIAIFDYGSGNVFSVRSAFDRLGIPAVITTDFKAARAADGLVIAGVGSFGATLTKLRGHRVDHLVDARLAGGRAVLGICVGLQVLFESSAESPGVTGLEQWPGHVERLSGPVLPHMNWTPVVAGQGSTLLNGLSGESFYFVHSFAAKSLPIEPAEHFIAPVVSTAKYQGEEFLAAIENGALTATQFHPEKSGEAGLEFLKNWAQSTRSS